MAEMSIYKRTERETFELGRALSQLLRPGDVVTLEGQLGVGKTVFARGMATGLGVQEPVTSPTFTIIKEYQGVIPFYHMDAYRLEHSEEDIGFDEYFNDEAISVVEWAQYIEEYLPDERLDIQIEYVNQDERKFDFYSKSDRLQSVIKSLTDKESR